MNCSSLAKASLQCYKGMVLQVYTKAKVEKRVDDEEDDDGWLEECWNAAWMAGWMRRKETMEGHRRTPASLHTLYNTTTQPPPPPTHAQLRNPLSSKTISCRDCGHEGRPALCDLIAAWSDTYYVTRHLRSCSAFNRYSMPDNLRVCPGSSVVLRTNSSRD